MGRHIQKGVEDLLLQGIHPSIIREVEKTFTIKSYSKTIFLPKCLVPGKQSLLKFAFPGKQKTNRVCVFETPIDLLAVATMSLLEFGHNFRDNHMIAGGDLDQFLEDYPFDCAGTPQILLYIHNTDENREKAFKLREKYEKDGYWVVLMQPVERETFIDELKDFKKEECQKRKNA